MKVQNNTLMKILFVTIILVCASAPFLTLPGAISPRPNAVVVRESFILDTLTIYNPLRLQCDRDPLITASNERISPEKLISGELRWMALSRDLLKRWGGTFHFGDTLTVVAGDPSIDGNWIIQDTMNKRYRNRGDLLFDASTRSTGRWTNVTLTRKKMLRGA